MSSPTRQPKMIVLDEAGFYFGNNNDSLKRSLRDIDGIPNATYLVSGGQVFVFEKLVRLVEEQQKIQPEQPLDVLARSLITDATISAKDAVEIWDVMPEHYRLVGQDCGGLIIRHTQLNARLPEVFANKRAALNALADLLLGGIQAGTGEFTYRDQPMTLCDPIDTALLPPRPAIECGERPDSKGYTVLEHVAYRSGFDPVSEALFNDVKALDESWAIDSEFACLHAQNHVADIWMRATTLRLETLDDAADLVPEYAEQDLAGLRRLYPELHMLSDGSLYAWFDMYQMNGGWTADRDKHFLFYLLGQVVDRELNQEPGGRVGRWAAYALLRGDTLDEAIAFARAAYLYDNAVASLVNRIADAIRFITRDNKANELRGSPILTTLDAFQMCRSSSPDATSMVEQTLAHFEGKGV